MSATKSSFCFVVRIKIICATLLIISPNTAAAIAPHAVGTWVMFVQTSPTGTNGPIKIEVVASKQIATRLRDISRDNPFETLLLGLATSSQPEQLGEQIGQQFEADHIHDGWFLASPALLSLIQAIGQAALQELLGRTSPGGLPNGEAVVDIDGMADVLQCSTTTIRRLVAKNEIPFMRTGRILRFVPSDVLASLQRNR